MAHCSLSTGALELIISGSDVKEPVLQVLGMKKISSNDEQDCYSPLLSDGKHCYSVTLLSLKRVPEPQIISDFSIIKIDTYFHCLIKGEPVEYVIISILDVKVLIPGEKLGHITGSPVSLDPMGFQWENNEKEKEEMHRNVLVRVIDRLQQLDVNK